MRVEVTSSTGSSLSAITWVGSHPDRSALLVHGLASNALTWTGVARHLNELGATVVAIDQRSHGHSEVTNDGYTFDVLTDDLAAVMRETGLVKPIVAGQSWGGNVALDLAHRRGPDLAGVVGVDGGTIELWRAFPNWSDAAQALAPPDFTGATIDQLRTMIRQARPDWPDEGIEGTLGNFRETEDGTAVARLPRQQHMAILHALWKHRPAELLDDIDIPATFIYASEGPGGGRPPAWVADPITVRGDHDLHAQRPTVVGQIIAEAAGWE